MKLWRAGLFDVKFGGVWRCLASRRWNKQELSGSSSSTRSEESSFCLLYVYSKGFVLSLYLATLFDYIQFSASKLLGKKTQV
jgi:hypothetical protein